MKYNIIFLDFDGVLNGYDKYIYLFMNIIHKYKILKPIKKRYDPFSPHRSKVRRLAKIIKATDAVVVFTSTTRHSLWEKDYSNRSKRLQKLANLFTKYGITVIGITPYFKQNRIMEIETWLEYNRSKVREYVILDDEDLSHFGYHFIKTSDIKPGEKIKGHPYENTGLFNRHVKQAIRILNQE